eukprot:11008864-Ditylum_brightwellii.AAC.2
MLKPPHPGKKNNFEAGVTKHAIMLEAMMGQHVAKQMKMTAKVDIDGTQTSNMHINCTCANWIALFEYNWVISQDASE